MALFTPPIGRKVRRSAVLVRRQVLGAILAIREETSPVEGDLRQTILAVLIDGGEQPLCSKR
jgi:hypothetical protein